MVTSKIKLFVLVLMISILFGTSEKSFAVTLGDVNNDGMVNVYDALLTLQYAVGLIEHTPENNTWYLLSADVAPLDAGGKPKGDGVVNIFDALAILRHVAEIDTW